jgi:hypothetical protein
MILNIPDPLAFFRELSEVAVIVKGKVTPEALYVLHKYEQELPIWALCDGKSVPMNDEAREVDACRQLLATPRPEYVPMAVPCDGDNPDDL